MARILVIEDNPVNMELMTYLLHAWGHELVTAADGEAGLQAARAAFPDLVICDIQLPGPDGYAVARRMRADPAMAAVPLVAVTAFAMVGDEERAIAAGFDLHIPKPIDPLRFMEVVSRLLPGQGRAPAVDVSPPPATPAPAVAESLKAPRPGLTLLLVDDRAQNLEFKQKLLEPAGYAVHAVASRDAALAVLRTRSVDLVISDVVMAGGDGFGLLAALRADPALRDLPFVFLTATARDPAEREKGLRLGAQEYLLRPIEPEALLAAIRAELTRARRP